MTEDIWDELWETMPVVVYGLRGGKSTHVDWLNKVKAEGDKLREKAEKGDKLETSELLHDIIVNGSKLESVKKHLDTIVIPSVSDITYLKNLLEAEGAE